MSDRTVNLGCVVACLLWMVTVALLIGATVAFDRSAHLALMLSTFGLAFSAASATATIRRYFVVQNQLLKNAFEFGREAGSVRRLPTAR